MLPRFVLCATPAVPHPSSMRGSLHEGPTELLPGLFGNDANLAADLPARRGRRVDVRVGRPPPDGGDHRGQVSRRELLGGHRAGDDVGHRNRPTHGPLLRTLR